MDPQALSQLNSENTYFTEQFVTCTSRIFISIEEQQPLWSLANHALFIFFFIIIASSNYPQNTGTPCVFLSFTSTHFLLLLLPVSYLSLWYLKKVCNFHFVLRASIGAHQVTVLHLRCLNFLLPQHFFSYFFSPLKTTIPILPSSSSALQSFCSFFSPSFCPVTLNGSSDTYLLSPPTPSRCLSLP